MTPHDFRPLLGLGNTHVQTILANLMSRSGVFLPGTMRSVPLEDGDALAVFDDFPKDWRDGDPWTLLVHGLGGCHSSPYLERIAARLLLSRCAVSRLDLRGAGAGLPLARKMYCAACTGDIQAVVEAFHRLHPASPIFLAGFSLGGNIVLRWAGEYRDARPASLAGVVSVSAPVDMVRSAGLIARHRFYNRYYVRRLIDQVRQHEAVFPQIRRARFPPKPFLRDFDDAYTAPNWGYTGAMDYYRQASSLPMIPTLDVPAYLLTANDDPFVAAESLRSFTPPSTMKIVITEHGGHLGFLGRDRFGGFRWFEAEVASWILSRVDSLRVGAR